MNFFKFLDSDMTPPTNYSWFHIMFIVIVILVTVLVCIFFRNSKEKTMKRILLITWIVILTLEILKQINYTVEYSDGTLKLDYKWYAFPFQLCSAPLYALPVIVFLPRKGKISTLISDCFIAFSCFFAFFGGLVVMIYPNDVFTSTIFINFQTMIHHGSQVMVGIFLMVYYRKEMNFKFFVKSLPVFGVFLLTALLLNVSIRPFLSESFNMYYISPMPGERCHLPILSTIFDNTPYIVFLFVYTIGFAFAAFLIFMIAFGIIKLVEFIKNKKQQNE